ncbi:MAG: hypothetical protein ACI4RN_02225, partial [Oscillospiraceae bacterium]
KKYKKLCIFLLSAMILCMVNIGGTMAWLTARSEDLHNSLVPGKVQCKVDETFENNIKSKVRIKNTSNVPAYLRGAIVVTWQDKEGSIYGKAPIENIDYTLSLNTFGWTEKNGYYYWNKAVKPNDFTSVLISECRPLKASPSEEYSLNVEILAEAVQAEPIKAVEEAWGFVPGGGQGV